MGFDWRAWLTAARPAAHGMLALPLLFGQALALVVTGSFSWLWFFLIHLFGALCQIYILYLNDYADEPLDRLNEDYWLSGGSRVIPEGRLTGDQLLRGAWLAAGAMLVLGVCIVFLERPWMLGLITLAGLLGWSYSLPPIKASYRGFGEIHQALSCGVLLPVVGFYVQSGAFGALPWQTLLPLIAIFFASNMVTALPDTNADRQGGKVTYAVRFGQASGARHATLVLLIGITWVMIANMSLGVTPLIHVLISAPSLVLLAGTTRILLSAQTLLSRRELMQRFMMLTLAAQAWILSAWVLFLFWLGTSN